MTEKIKCPLAGSGRRGWGCGCGREAPEIDLRWYKVKANATRTIAHRIKMLTRFRSNETLTTLAAEEGVSIKRVHDILFGTFEDVKHICGLSNLIETEKSSD